MKKGEGGKNVRIKYFCAKITVVIITVIFQINLAILPAKITLVVGILV